MLKLKRIDLLTKKMIKSTRNGYCDHVQDIRNLSACVENIEELGWVVDCSLGGERWDRKEKEGKTEEESVSRWGGYIIVFSDGITDGYIPSVTVPRHYTTISV
jgi:hypothetical protein